MRERRFELPHSFEYSDLNAARLPFRHSRITFKATQAYRHIYRGIVPVLNLWFPFTCELSFLKEFYV